MQILRTILWVLVLVALLAFSFFNWQPVEVTIWPSLVLETKIPALVIVAFLLGLIPTWLLHRGVKWRLNRRISSLENAARANAVTPSPAPAETTPTPPPPVDAPGADASALTSEDPAKQ